MITSDFKVNYVSFIDGFISASYGPTGVFLFAPSVIENSTMLHPMSYIALYCDGLLLTCPAI